MGGKNENKDTTVVDGIRDGGGPIVPWSDVARGDPAADASGFEVGADAIGNGFVVMGVGDEDFVGHITSIPEFTQSLQMGNHYQLLLTA